MAKDTVDRNTGSMTTNSSTAVIRQWARDNGLPVGDRGRLSPQLLSAYAISSAPPTAAEAGSAPTRELAPRRLLAAVARVAVHPTPGATGITRKIAARSS